MAIPATREALRLGGNLNFGAGGMSIDFLIGTFVKNVVEDELTGVVTIEYQDVDGAPQTASLDGSLLINAAPDANPQPVANAATFADRRLWWDGVTLKYVARTPGHGLQVNWPDYASPSYRGEHRDNPPNFQNNQFYYHLGAHTFVYRINGRNVGGTPPGWRGHRANQSEAEDLVTANGQLFEWDDNVHVSANYVAPVDDDYFWKSLFGDIAHDADKTDTDLGNVDDDLTDDEQEAFRGKVGAAKNTGRPSGLQIATGTDIEPRQWAVLDVVEAISEHERFTDVDRDVLEDIARVSFPHPTDDWRLRQTYYPDQFFANRPEVFLSLGWDADNRLRALSGTGHVGRLGEHDQGRIYDGATRLRGGLISGTNWVFLTDSGTGSRIARAPVSGGVDAQLLVLGSQYFNIFADPDSGTLIGLLRRVSATQLEISFLSYDAVAGSLTAEDVITVERTALDIALGSEFENLTDVHTESSVGLERNVVGALLDGDTLYLLLTSLEKTDGHFSSVLLGYTIAGNPASRTLTPLDENALLELPIADDLRSGILPEDADELFVARDTSAYRLSPRPEAVVAEETEWVDIQGRPNRPTVEEIIDGTSVAEAVPSVSDVVAIANAHSQRSLSNADPENVGNEAAEGTEAAVSRRDHGHRFPHNNTIQYDETAENFGINIHDVTEHTGQTVRYFTNEDTFTNGGGLSEGQIYTTSGFRKLITKVQLQTSNILEAHFRVRIKTVDADRKITGDLGRSYAVNPGSTNPHSYPFYDADGAVGIIEEGNQRIAIILEGNEAGDTPALRYGDQESDSPGESYPDASVDFHLENDVVYADRDPAIGQHSHSHGNRIRGNIKIFYQLIYGHDDLGSAIEPSDAIPQPNTTDGSAGDSDEVSRANHSHPGTAGGGSGESIEVLFDNRADTETALSVLAGGVDWARTVDIGFSRALVEADDDKDVRLRYEITQGGQVRHFDELFSAATFRLMPEYPAVSGSIMPTTGHLVLTGVDGRTSRTATSLFGRVSIGVRQRTATGEDALRILMSSSGNSHVAATNIRGIVELVPRVGGSVSEAQAASGANLTRSTVALDVQQTTNAFEFDVRAGGTIGVGNYQINPIPVADIFDLVASVRVDGRAAFPMRLSKEQFDLVGESPELVQTGAWPFAGTGGTTWGDVTEIPCAMMYIDHVTEGIVKNLINPQRQQIGWTITGSLVATAILFFFDYDDAEENLTNVRVVAFSNSVVVIEGLHIHYWQGS